MHGAVIKEHFNRYQEAVVLRSVQQLLEAFDQLENTEKQTVITELLLRVQTIEIATVSDEELVFAADDVFLGLDREEALGQSA